MLVCQFMLKPLLHRNGSPCFTSYVFFFFFLLQHGIESSFSFRWHRKLITT